MSAWLCNDRHTAILAHYAVSRGITEGPASHVGAVLRDANNQALHCCRYSDKRAPYRHVPMDPRNWTWTDRQINTLARSFDYQCSEGDVMETHVAAGILNKIIEITGRLDVDIVEGLWGGPP